MNACPLCGKELKNVKYHLWRVHGDGRGHNPHSGHVPGSRVAWNKGLTKETSEIVAQMAASCSKSQVGRLGKPLSDETKKKISDARKLYLELNPDRVPFLMNHSSKISYPEQYFIDCFAGTSLVFQHRVFRYKLDFANVEHKIYLEIDGEQHYQPAMIEHDARRTAKLAELGWIGYRIRWAHFQKLSAENKLLKVQELHSLMKLVS